MTENKVRPTGKAQSNAQNKGGALADQAALEAVAASIVENKRLAFMIVHAWLNKHGCVMIPKTWINQRGLVMVPRK